MRYAQESKGEVMKKAYKLTDSKGFTQRRRAGETLWKVGTTVVPTGSGNGPCGPGVLHAYISPEVAVLGNPIHAEIQDPRLFRVEAEHWTTDGLKRWTTKPVNVLEELPIPVLTVGERVAWVICLIPSIVTRDWAVSWLSGADRSWNAATRTAEEAEAAARASLRAWPSKSKEHTAIVEAEKAALWAAAAAARAAMWAAPLRTAPLWETASVAAAAALAASLAASASIATGLVTSTAAETRLDQMLLRARAILAGTYPADQYDAKLDFTLSL